MTTNRYEGPLCTGIVDIHHDDGSFDLDDVAADGVVGMFIKCSEGVTYQDPSYVQVLDRLRAAKMLRGAYHFARGTSDAEAQADVFCDDVKAMCDTGGEDVLVALDLEGDLSNPRTMSTEDAARFIERVSAVLRRKPLVYMGLSKGRERMREASDRVRSVFGACDLWLAAYGPKYDPRTIEVPTPWETYALHQYTNGTDGPRDRELFPRHTKGFTREAQDRSCFRGTVEQLRAWWLSYGRK